VPAVDPAVAPLDRDPQGPLERDLGRRPEPGTRPRGDRPRQVVVLDGHADGGEAALERGLDRPLGAVVVEARLGQLRVVERQREEQVLGLDGRGAGLDRLDLRPLHDRARVLGEPLEHHALPASSPSPRRTR
jgi:hypothetical protein